ncbi:MAG: hypothetical protein KME23_21805 [Goleter apudmare HA4340-LM2]|jgi:hypothetical protein|nr:hypothetical protein [Goleter apudmare HA4340-LM2]
MMQVKTLKKLSIASLSILSCNLVANYTVIGESSRINESSNISEPNLSPSLNEQQLIAQSVRRLNFSWRVAPGEQAAIGTEILIRGGTDTIGNILRSGQDIYVVKVRLFNTGNVPLRIHPQNIKVFYGNRFSRSISVIPVTDNRFLQPDILKTNHYIDKPVIFTAPIGLKLPRDIRMGYADNSIRVTY